jgi:ribosome-associated protein
MTTQQIVHKIAKLAWDKKGQDIVIMDLRKLTNVTDFFVLVSGESELHIKALFEHIENELKKNQVKAWHKEGIQKLSWVLLDYIDIVVHIFKPESRDYYSLEKLWADAKITKFEENVKSTVLSESNN